MVPRYRLHAGDLLRRLLDNHRDGEPGSVRELAAAIGMSKSKVDALVREVRPTLTGDEARRLAQAYGLPPRALFHPMSTSMDMDADPLTRKETRSGFADDARRTLAQGTPGVADQLGEHTRPAVEDGEGPSRGRRPL